MLYLFDIDGTLISPGPAARKAISRAIKNYTGVEPNLVIKDVAGLTDRLVVKNAILKCNMTPDSDIVNEIVTEYLTMFEGEYLSSNSAFVYEDSIELLNRIIDSKHPLGLLTGNDERGAQIKLGKFDLFKYFPFGVYGNDGETRNDLPIVAKKRAESIFRQNFNFEDIVLIGDTPEDAIAARSNGCKSIIVCRREEWFDEIVSAGADTIVKTLDDPKIVI